MVGIFCELRCGTEFYCTVNVHGFLFIFPSRDLYLILRLQAHIYFMVHGVWRASMSAWYHIVQEQDQ